MESDSLYWPVLNTSYNFKVLTKFHATSKTLGHYVTFIFMTTHKAVH
jgi:hypothetical protein